MPKTQKVTINDIAKAANVSNMTVSRVLNNKGGASPETRHNILRIADEMGYVANAVAKRLRGTNNTIGLVIADVFTPFVGELLQSISVEADKAGYGLMLYAQGKTQHIERSEHYASLIVSGINDGVILLPTVDYDAMLWQFIEHDFPYVLIDHHRDNQEEPVVFPSNREGMQDATRHLMALGHRQIGFITGDMGTRGARDRLEGYLDVFDEIGVEPRDSLIVNGNYKRITGFEMARHLLNLEEPPTAIIASNDDMAFGVMEAIKDNGLHVGTDISVVGFDDVPMASETTPKLTTVRQPISELGIVAFETLTTLIERGSLISNQRKLATTLIVRDSTGPPNT